MTEDFVAMLKGWDQLGGSVQAQAYAVWNGEPLEEQNPNALREIKGWAEQFSGIELQAADLAIYALWETITLGEDDES